MSHTVRIIIESSRAKSKSFNYIINYADKRWTWWPRVNKYQIQTKNFLNSTCSSLSFRSGLLAKIERASLIFSVHSVRCTCYDFQFQFRLARVLRVVDAIVFCERFLFVRFSIWIVGGPVMFNEPITYWPICFTVIVSNVHFSTFHHVALQAVHNVPVGAFPAVSKCCTRLAANRWALWRV